MHSSPRRESVAQIDKSVGHWFVFRWLALLMSRRRHNATRARLDLLDDRMLRDVGLRRDQLFGTVERLPRSPQDSRFL
jgi:uncharacterized protein YjiS (DUF1127 family)